MMRKAIVLILMVVIGLLFVSCDMGENIPIRYAVEGTGTADISFSRASGDMVSLTNESLPWEYSTVVKEDTIVEMVVQGSAEVTATVYYDFYGTEKVQRVRTSDQLIMIKTTIYIPGWRM